MIYKIIDKDINSNGIQSYIYGYRVGVPYSKNLSSMCEIDVSNMINKAMYDYIPSLDSILLRNKLRIEVNNDIYS